MIPCREPVEPVDGWKYRVAMPYLNEQCRINVIHAIDEKSVSSASHWVDDMTTQLLQLYTRMSVAQPCCNGYNALVLALQV